MGRCVTVTVHSTRRARLWRLSALSPKCGAERAGGLRFAAERIEAAGAEATRQPRKDNRLLPLDCFEIKFFWDLEPPAANSSSYDKEDGPSKASTTNLRIALPSPFRSFELAPTDRANIVNVRQSSWQPVGLSPNAAKTF